METLNKKLLELIFEIKKAYSDDPELSDVVRDLTRVSKYLLEKELKKFNNGNTT